MAVKCNANGDVNEAWNGKFVADGQQLLWTRDFVNFFLTFIDPHEGSDFTLDCHNLLTREMNFYIISI